MRKLVYVCDRCLKEVSEDAREFSTGGNLVVDVRLMTPEGGTRSEYIFDFCSKCYPEVEKDYEEKRLEFIGSLPKNKGRKLV